MKKWIIIVLCFIVLTGCSSNADYETIGNVCDEPMSVYIPAQIELVMPEESDMKETATVNGTKYYRFGDCQVWVDVLQTGNLSATIEEITGQNPEKMTVIAREMNGYSCYETTWSAMAEEGMHIGRLLVADNGKHHYCIALMMPEESSENVSEVMGQILEGIQIRDTVQ